MLLDGIKPVRANAQGDCSGLGVDVVWTHVDWFGVNTDRLIIMSFNVMLIHLQSHYDISPVLIQVL